MMGKKKEHSIDQLSKKRTTKKKKKSNDVVKHKNKQQ